MRDYSDIAVLLKSYMFRRGLKLKELAPLIGYTEPTVSNYLRHPQRMSIETLHRMKQVLKIPDEEFRRYM